MMTVKLLAILIMFMIVAIYAYKIGRRRRNEEVFRLQMDNLRLVGKISLLRSRLSLRHTGVPTKEMKNLEETLWD